MITVSNVKPESEVLHYPYCPECLMDLSHAEGCDCKGTDTFAVCDECAEEEGS